MAEVEHLHSELTLTRPADFIPKVLREHGLSDAHVFPAVSYGKQPDGTFRGSRRVSPADAWRFPSIELRTSTSWPVLLIDLDGAESTQWFLDLVLNQEIPRPNWWVTRHSSQGTHAAWTLERPVHRPHPNTAPRRKPIHLFTRISEYYTTLLEGDSSFRGVLTHNPVSLLGRRQGLITTWGRRAPYSLKELAAIIPPEWHLPPVKKTAIGRNCDLFATGMRWAGSPQHIGLEVLPMLLATNQQFSHPLPEQEVGHIARSIERYREDWIARGTLESSAAFSARQSQRGKRGGRQSGQVRKAESLARHAARNSEILHLAEHGLSERRIAQELHTPKTTVHRVIQDHKK